MSDRQRTPEDLVALRERTHGPAVLTMRKIAQLWSGLFGIHVKPEEVPLAMMLVKIARESNSHHQDNLDDIGGYRLIYERIVREQEGDDRRGSGSDRPDPVASVQR